MNPIDLGVETCLQLVAVGERNVDVGACKPLVDVEREAEVNDN